MTDELNPIYFFTKVKDTLKDPIKLVLEEGAIPRQF